MSVATNEQYLKAFNDYLQDHNLVQAKTDGRILAGQTVVPVNFDMFFQFLVDKIVLSVINSHSFIDKLDGLYSGNLDVGAVIEDKLTVLKGKNYEYDTQDFEADVTNPYRKSKKGLSVCFHKLNAFKKIRLTISYDQLRTGCLTEGGINDIVSNMINDVQVEYSAWAYDEKKKLLTNKDYAEVVYFDDYADFTLKLKGVKIDLTNYDDSWKHNASLLFTPTNQQNLRIVMSERWKNKVDINFFTGLFNVSYAEIKDNIIYIDQFDDPDVVCGIYDKRGFFFKKALDTSRELENGEDLTRNRFLHFWRMHSVSPHYAAVVFKQTPATAIAKGQNILVKSETTDVQGSITFEKNVIYTLDGSIPSATNGTFLAKETALTINNPKTIAPVVIKTITLADDAVDVNGTQVENSLSVSHVRFEYPADIDATLGMKGQQ